MNVAAFAQVQRGDQVSIKPARLCGVDAVLAVKQQTKRMVDGGKRIPNLSADQGGSRSQYFLIQ